MTTPLDRIREKIGAGESLSQDDVSVLSETRDLLCLGLLADERRRALKGDRVTFVRVAEVFGAPDGTHTLPRSAGELRIVGCEADADTVLGVVRERVAEAGDVPVTGFALDEIVALCNNDAVRFDDVVRELRDAGLAFIAEARLERTPDPTWLQRAHTAGVPVARLTVHEPSEAGVAAVQRVSAWGDDAFVRAFAPLPRMVFAKPSTGYDDVRQVALARLLVDNIGSMQVDWSLYGPKLAQVALMFGADDVDAVSPIDSHEDGRRRAPLEEITQNIKAVARVPVQRNGRFDPVSQLRR